MSGAKPRTISRRCLRGPALFLALGAVLLCFAPAVEADQINPEGHTITGKNPGMKVMGKGEHLTNMGTINITHTDSGSMGVGMGSGVPPKPGTTLINRGTITVSNIGEASWAIGMFGGNGSMANTGTITALSSSITGYAYGMRGNGNSTMANRGAITADATGGADIPGNLGGAFAFVGAYGMSGGDYGTLANNGVIAASATSGTASGISQADASARACGMSGDDSDAPGISGTITAANRGAITADATGGSASATGSFFDGLVADASARAYGMWGGPNSTLANSGTIAASATGGSATYAGTNPDAIADASVIACGMWGGPNSTLANSGAITASATGGSASATGAIADASVSASGMSGGSNSTLANSGAITASATGGSASATGTIADAVSAYGMSGGSNSTLANSGAITATASGAPDSAVASGMSGGSNSTLANSGAITATASGAPNSAVAYGMSGGSNSTLANSGAITATASGASGRIFASAMYAEGENTTLANSGAITATTTAPNGKASGISLDSGTAANFGLIRAVAPDPANASELYNRSITDTVHITDWATELRDFRTDKVFASNGGTLDFSGSTFILRPGDKERGFAWGKEYAVADMTDVNHSQGAVASVTAEVPWLRARLTGTDWTDQKLSLHPNVTRKTNPGQRVSRQGVAIVTDQMRGLDRVLGQFRNSSAPAAFTTASGPDLGPDSRPDENGWSGFLTPYFSYVDNSDLDYDAKIVGFMAGATRRFNNRFAAGVHLGFSHAEVSADLADQNGDALTGLLGLHAVYTLTPEWYVRGQVTGFLSRASDSWKSGLAAYPLYADADVDSRGVYASLATGYAWRINASNTLTPELGLSWLWSQQDAYSLNWEDRFGNRLPGYDLDYKAEDYTALYGTAMVRWQGAFALGDSVFRPSLGLGLRQTLTDNDIKSRLTTNGSSFSTRVSADDTTALAEAGLSWQHGNTTLGFTYTGDYGSDQRAHAGWLTLKVAF